MDQVLDGGDFLIKKWVGWAIISTLIFYLITPYLNRLLKEKYVIDISKELCSMLYSIKNEEWKFLVYSLCKSISDSEINKPEMDNLIVQIERIFSSSFLQSGAVLDTSYREERIKQVVSYSVSTYLHRIKTEKYIDTNKPIYILQQVEKNKEEFNEDQLTLLRQARYTEFNSDGSLAQSVLGPKRELTYVGLKFPYGSELQED